MKTATLLSTFLTLASLMPLPSAAQDLREAPPASVDKSERVLSPRLFRLEAELGRRGRLAPNLADSTLFQELGVPRRGTDEIEIEIISADGQTEIDDGLLRGLGAFDLRGNARHRAVWIPYGRLRGLATAMPTGVHVRAVRGPEFDGDPADDFADDTGATEYIDAGSRGAGIRIGIINGGFEKLDDAQDVGTAPPDSRLTTRNYTSSGLQTGGMHGTACLETVYDHAPAAEYFVYKVNSAADTWDAVQRAINDDVHILSHSLSRYNLGWGDDPGIAAEAANLAAENGILFFTSAGNRADAHWEGSFVDADGDGWHEFANGDETINVTLPAGKGGSFYLSWANATSHDIDLYLYDSAGDIVERSDSGASGAFEDFDFYNPESSTQTYHLAVYSYSGTHPKIEVFYHGDTNFDEHRVEQGSTTSPSNATEFNVVSVGAVRWSNWSQPSGTSGLIQSYSSNGPSNSGMTLPDICGATGNWTVAYSSASKPEGGFGGTSCATPNVAGIAAVFWSEFSTFTASAVRSLLFDQAVIYRDWGESGKDNVYGKGGCSCTRTTATPSGWIRASRTGCRPSGPLGIIARQPARSVDWRTRWTPRSAAAGWCSSVATTRTSSRSRFRRRSSRSGRTRWWRGGERESVRDRQNRWGCRQMWRHPFSVRQIWRCADLVTSCSVMT